MKKKIISIVTSLTVITMMMPMAPVMATISAGCRANLNTCTIAELIEYSAELQAQLTALQGTTPAATYTGIPAGFTFAKNLSQGMTDSDVVNLKIVLAAEGCVTGLSNNQYFGSLTLAGVKCLQLKYKTQISAAAGYTISASGFVGAGTRTQLNALLGGTGGGGVIPPPVGAALSVSLNAASPASANIVTGSANNVVAILDFVGSASAATQINTLRINSYGTVNPNAATDISGIKIFDGTNQVGFTMTLIGGQVTFAFAPAITIPAGGTKQLKITADIAATGVATVMTTVRLGISGATSIGGATFTGTFPVVSNTFTIVPGGALGAIAVTAGGVVPVNLTRVGATDVVLGNFIVSAGTVEDLSVSQFNVLATSTMLDSDVTNVRLKVDGVLQAGSGTFTLRRATLNFASPIPVTKGTSKVFQVIGDIASGVGRQIELGMQANGVLANGALTGVGVAGPAVTFYLGLPNDIVMNRGGLSVAVSASSPQGTAAVLTRSVIAQTLGVYDIRAIGENILVTNVNLTFTDNAVPASGTIATIGLYDEYGALLSNFQTVTDALIATNLWGGAAVPFVLNWTVPANTTMKLYIKGITNGITAPNPASIVPTLPGAAAITGTGLSSGGVEGAGNIVVVSALALPVITIWQGPLFGLIGDVLVTPRNQAILGPVSQAVVATIKVTAGREDQTLRSLDLACNTAGGNCANYYSNVAIYDGATQITNYVVPTAASTTFAAQDIINPLTFTVGVPKTLKIVANTLGIAAGTSSWAIDAGGMRTAGVTSGQIALSAATDLRTNSGGLGANTGGVLTAFPDVLEMKVNAISPSGTISRDTFGTVAKWDLISRGVDPLGVDVSSIFFTSKTGGLTSATNTDTGLVRLYDETNGVVLSLPASTTIDKDLGTIRFQMATGTLRVSPLAPTTISLQMTTVSTAKFPAYTSFWFTVINAASTTVTAAIGGAARGTGFGGSVWSIPTDAYKVSLGL